MNKKELPFPSPLAEHTVPPIFKNQVELLEYVEAYVKQERDQARQDGYREALQDVWQQVPPVLSWDSEEALRSSWLRGIIDKLEAQLTKEDE